MAHEGEFDAVDIEALEGLTGDVIDVVADGGVGEVEAAATPPTKRRKKTAAPTRKSPKKTRKKGAGLPKKYAKMGFKKGWREYKKTPAYKRKKKGR